MRRPEQDIQRAVIRHLKLRSIPGVFFFAVPNGGYRLPVEAAILKGLGVKSGVPDVIIIHCGHVFCLELKSERGRLSPKQRETLADLERAGAHTCVAAGLDAALSALEEWQLLRGVMA